MHGSQTMQVDHFGHASLGCERDGHYVDRHGVAWRRERIPPPCSNVDEPSPDGGAPENARVDDKLGDAEVEEVEDIDDAKHAEAVEGGCDVDAEVEYEYEHDEELEYAD